MVSYIDGFVFPIAQNEIDDYQKLSNEVANIWLEYGALDYQEFKADGSSHSETLAFPVILEAQKDEVIIFGFMTFESKANRDKAHEQVANDPRMVELMAKYKVNFDPARMAFGGFEKLVEVKNRVK